MLERAHIVQAVGELDEDYANVGDHCEQHLADVLGLVILAVGKLDLVQLGDALDDVGHLLAEALLDLAGGDVGVFDGVVQEAGGDGGGIHLQLREHQGYLERMHDVGFAGSPLLPLVMLETELPSLADDFQVVAGAILVDLLEQAGELRVHLADNGRTRSGEVPCGALRRGSRGTAGRGAGLGLDLGGIGVSGKGKRWRRNRRQSCAQLNAYVRVAGSGTRPLKRRGCGSFQVSGGRWSVCHS